MTAASELVEKRLELVGQLADGRVSHRRAHSLHRVDGAEEPRYGSVARATLQLEERGIDLREILATLGKKELGVPSCVHLGQHPLDCLEHPARLERLDHEVAGTGLQRFLHQRLLSHGAAHEDARARDPVA